MVVSIPIVDPHDNWLTGCWGCSCLASKEMIDPKFTNPEKIKIQNSKYGFY